jgi:hypothetical protein
MPLEPELLQKAQDAGAELAELERQTSLARAEYHTAVRRLHLGGGSLREIAPALALSHQRVQQIVSGAGGSWWTRMWRTRRVRLDAVCTWCERPPSEVDKLIAGPSVYICDGCVAAAERAVAGRANSRGFGMKTRGAAARCAFCFKRAGKDRTLAASAVGHVCTACLRICRDILDGRAA